MNQASNNYSENNNRRKATDYGGKPYVTNIGTATMQNDVFRRAIWTGNNLQMTLMNIPVGTDIGLEIHREHDQFLYIESGMGRVEFGECCDKMKYSDTIGHGSGIFVPAGNWHNVINTGRIPLKLFTIYAPPHHQKGTVNVCKPTED